MSERIRKTLAAWVAATQNSPALCRRAPISEPRPRRGPLGGVFRQPARCYFSETYFPLGV